MKASLLELTYQKYIDYIKQQMVNAKEIENFEIHNLLDFASCMFDKGVTGTVAHRNSA